MEKFHDTVDELDASMDNLTMEVVKLFAQVSHQVEVHEGKKIWLMRWTRGYACSSLHQRDFGIECSDDPFVKVKKLIQDLIWKLQLKFLRKTGRQLQIVQKTSLQQEILNANFIRNEEKATNEEVTKDVWDAQSILTETIQILSDFYAKVTQSDSARLESETTETEFEVGSTFDEFTGKTVEGAWDGVEAIAYDPHLRDNTTKVICEYSESSITGH